MLFDSFNYWIFFVTALVVLAALTDRASRLGLALFGFAFYAFWNPWFTLLLGGSIVANFSFGIWIEQAAPNRRHMAVTTAIVLNLALLCFFKYYGFFLVSLSQAFGFDPHSLFLKIILPVGISFFTFEGIAYAVDVYRRDTPAVRSLTNFAVFMSFFPHLIAGPIIRPASFFPQLAKRGPLATEAANWGLIQILKGLVKKIIFADYFALIANAYFSHQLYQGQSVPAAVGVLGFSLQIYFDFAGYTDIARGCARLLGYEFPPNFERPYLSSNITDFWRRWHISLSTWLRDYLYIPLGGNRRGGARTYLNIFIVMVLGGLWHGASWNFIIWGLYHGILLMLHRTWRANLKPRLTFKNPVRWITQPASMLFTFVVVCVGWIPFRAADLPTTRSAITELFSPGIIPFLQTSPFFIVLFTGSLVYCLADPHRKLEDYLTNRASTITVATTSVFVLLLIEVFGQFGLQVPFIYFQF